MTISTDKSEKNSFSIVNFFIYLFSENNRCEIFLICVCVSQVHLLLHRCRRVFLQLSYHVHCRQNHSLLSRKCHRLLSRRVLQRWKHVYRQCEASWKLCDQVYLHRLVKKFMSRWKCQSLWKWNQTIKNIQRSCELSKKRELWDVWNISMMLVTRERKINMCRERSRRKVMRERWWWWREQLTQLKRITREANKWRRRHLQFYFDGLRYKV